MKKIFGAILALLLTGPVFGQAISHLPSGTTPTGTEFIPIVQGGVTVKVTPAQILSYIDAQTITWTNPQTYQQLMTLNGGLTVSAGNISLTGGNLSFSGTGNATLSNSGYFFSSASVKGSLIGTSTGGVAIGVDNPNAGSVTWSYSSGSTDNKFWRCGTNFDGPLIFSCQEVNDAWSSAQSWIEVTRNGATTSIVNIPNGVFEVNSRPENTYGLLQNTGTACNIYPTYANSNLLSCTRNGTGSITVSFTNSFSTPAACVASPSGSSPAFVTVFNSTLINVQIYSFNSSGTQADVQYIYIICK